MFTDSQGFNIVKALENIIRAQNLELIKNIAKFKNWDEEELINKFIINSKQKKSEVPGVPVKRGRGRPPGSKNNKKKNNLLNDNTIKTDQIQIKKRGRGRPPGSKNKKNKEIKEIVPIKKRGRGRPRKRILQEVNFDSLLPEDDTFDIDNFSQSSNEDFDNLEKIIDTDNQDQDNNEDFEEIVCKFLKYEGEEYLFDPKNNNVYQNNGDNMFLGKWENNKINYNATE